MVHLGKAVGMQTILIVEAVAAQRDLLVSWLQDEYTVLTAVDGAAGVALATQAEPDLIFMALALPDRAAVESMRWLHVQPRLREIPLIALTASARPEEEATARAAGCVGTLPAPFDEDQVAGVLRSWLGGG